MHRSSRRNEYDDAVTTDIVGKFETAFDEQPEETPGDLFVTDVSLSTHVDLESGDILPASFILKDRFEIVELVYAAGMSFVYKAIDQRRDPESSGDKYVAIKIMRPSIGSGEQAGLALEREASITQSLSHPNIIDIVDFDDNDGQPFLVMEWLEGESLNALLRRTSGNAVEPELARALITLAATGLQHAHRNNVVHADINPSNVFITDTQEIKLLDFGVARYVTSPERAEDGRFTWVTQTYASPDVLAGLPPVVEDDVFSLGCVVYRLLSGRHPFGGSPSLVARNKGLSVEPIPELPARQWEILRRALSFERADRPSDLNDFVIWPATNAVVEELPVRPARGSMPEHWKWLAAAAALATLAGGYWLTQRGANDEVVAPLESPMPEESAAVDPGISAGEALVVAATRALEEEQLIEPADVSARALFRAALVLEGDNPEALRGLRTISDVYVQEAQVALGQDNPVEAYAALAVATDTDPGNPSIAIVDQLLIVKGDSELAEARLAITTGDFDAAAQKISQAEQYRHIDETEVRNLRQGIEERRQEDLLLDRLAAADAHIAADRLQVPEGDNAYAVLIELDSRFGGDARVLASKERLGERLLLRAGSAIDDAQLGQASEALDAVDALGVLASEVETLRLSLIADANVAEAVDTTNVQEAVSRIANEQPVVAAEPGDLTTSPVVDQELDEPSNRTVGTQVTVPAEADPQAPAQAEAELRRYSLQELGIREYVAPMFPRAARRRNLSGMVEASFVINPDGRTELIEILHSEPGDVFSQSAIRAIGKWRFEARDEPFQTRVTLRFEQE